MIMAKIARFTVNCDADEISKFVLVVFYLNFTKILFKYGFVYFIILQQIPQDLAIKLKSQLEELRKTKGLQEAAEVKRSGPGERAEEMVVLTRSDASGNFWPLEMTERQEPRGGRRKRKKVIR